MAPPRPFLIQKSRKAVKSVTIQDIYDMTPSRIYGAATTTVQNFEKLVKSFRKNCWYIYAPNGNPYSVEQTMDDHHKRFRFLSTEFTKNILDEQFNPDLSPECLFHWCMMDLLLKWILKIMLENEVLVIYI